MNNEHIKITVTKESEAVSVTAEIPEMNPRKGIEHIRYDVVNARQSAVDKYGNDVGNLTTFSKNPVLENRPRENGTVLKGKWLFELKSKNSYNEGKAKSRRTRKTTNTKTRARRTTKTTTSE